MLKTTAINMLGGSASNAAKAIGISIQAVNKWPDELPARISDRVLAALARKYLPARIIGTEAKRTSAKA